MNALQNILLLINGSFAILFYFLISIIAAYLFFRLRWLRNKIRRVRIEDALKHLYDYEYQSKIVTIETLSSLLFISVSKIEKLIQQLESLRLIQKKDDIINLTPQGQSYALRIIRFHRLWERYLADETAVDASNWHKKAERREHFLGFEDAEKISKILGYPLFDPHGDPIPTTSGSIPTPKGTALSELSEGANAEIIHIEDEPTEIYNQIIQLGLELEMPLQIKERTSENIVIIVNEKEIALPQQLAANITVLPIIQEELKTYATLDSLEIGQSALVREISPACRGMQRRRLMDFGFVPGTRIENLFRSASGDPTAFKVRGTTVALRKQQSKLIHIEKIK